MPENRPNILIVRVDQIAGPVMVYAGHPVVRMPQLSALAAVGVIFENADCPSPLC